MGEAFKKEIAALQNYILQWEKGEIDDKTLCRTLVESRLTFAAMGVCAADRISKYMRCMWSVTKGAHTSP
jgi:hypothetical protein